MTVMVGRVKHTQPANDSDGGQSETHPAWLTTDGGQSKLYPAWLMTVMVGKVNNTQPG